METSNLYTTKILSEHPLAAWSLDDHVEYISQITEAQRSFSNWTITGAARKPLKAIASTPFPQSRFNLLRQQPGNDTVSAISPTVTQRSNLNKELETITLGVYVYINGTINPDTKALIGFKYGDAEFLETIQIKDSKKWVFLTHTFEIPSYTYYPNDDFRIIITLSNLTTSEKDIYVNGITFGQWSEEYCATNLGVSKTTIPTIIPVDATYGVPIIAKGLAADSDRAASVGYHLIENNRLLATTGGIPMVFGTDTTVTIKPGNGPSIIFPGLGFLHDNGSAFTSSVEFWLRINSDSAIPRRIFGPIDSKDGLYVEGPFLVWKVGDQYGSHYISEWYRPMLINISYSATSSSLMVNGKEVLFLNFDYSETKKTNSLKLPTNKYSNHVLSVNTDWLGFYSYPDISQIEIQNFTIYSYDVPSAIAKRRWVYGQAVQFPENTMKDNGGTGVLADYTVSKYSNNHTFPVIDSWQSSILEGVSIVNDTLSSPTYYDLPSLYFDTKTEDEWLSVIKESDCYGITLRPDSDWSNVNGYLLFDKLSSFRENITGIYGVFEVAPDFYAQQTLFKLFDQRTRSFILCTIFTTSTSDPVQVIYSFYSGITDQWKEIQISYIERGHSFATGINLDTLALVDSEIQAFLGNKQRLRLYLGGDESYNQTFSGYIHNFSFSNARNFAKLNEDISYVGVINPDQTSYDGGSATDEYWEYVVDGGAPDTVYVYNGDELLNVPFDEAAITVYDGGIVDELQLEDIDGGLFSTTTWSAIYDAAGVILTAPAGSYNNNLLDRFATYSLYGGRYLGMFELSIAAESYWEKTVPLKSLAKVVNEETSEYDIDYIQYNIEYPKPVSHNEDGWNTSKSLLKSYMSFQLDTNERKTSFTNSYRMPETNVIDASLSWEDSIFETVDGSVIYPPTTALDNILIVNHIEMKTPNVLKRPIRLKGLQIASKAITSYGENPIGTRLSKDIYPYEYNNGTSPFISTQKNPVLVYKRSTPHLYLTRNSGFTSLNSFGLNGEMGLAVPINEVQEEDFYLSSMIVSLRDDFESFPSYDGLIATIKYDTDYIDIYIKSIVSTNNRAKIFAKNRSDGSRANVTYSLNGRPVDLPIINSGTWNNIAIVFNDKLPMIDFETYHYIAFVAPITFNNLILNKDVISRLPEVATSLTPYYGITPPQPNDIKLKPKTITVGDSYQLWVHNYQKSYYDDITVTTKIMTPA